MLITMCFLVVFCIGWLICLIQAIYQNKCEHYDEEFDTKIYPQREKYLVIIRRWQRNVEDVSEEDYNNAVEQLKDLDVEAEPIVAKRDKYKNIYVKWSSDIVDLIKLCLIWCAGIALAICMLVILVNNSNGVVNKNVDMLNMEREALVYRLETQAEIGNELLYREIVEFNEKIYCKQYWHDSVWTSWFNPKEYAEIEQIDYKKIVERQQNVQ